MTTLDRIRKDALAARKAKSPQAGLLVTLIGEIETRTKSLPEQRSLSDEEVVALVRKFIKNAGETLAAIGDTRPEEAARLHADMAALEAYLPTQMSEDALRAHAQECAARGLATGLIMADLKTRFPGQYDGKLASQVVRKVLAG